MVVSSDLKLVVPGSVLGARPFLSIAPEQVAYAHLLGASLPKDHQRCTDT